MRISDWSSDVCSSDLKRGAGMRGMTDLWTSAEIAAATGGKASAPFVVSGVAFDSREVGSGDLFIALSGEATDGHRFVGQAFAAGAAGAIVGRAGRESVVYGKGVSVRLDFGGCGIV